jgi:hypothetical protein
MDIQFPVDMVLPINYFSTRLTALSVVFQLRMERRHGTPVLGIPLS